MTITINVSNAADARRIAAAVKQFKGVEDVDVYKTEPIDDRADNLDLLPYPIPGLPYTKEERIASVRKSMEQYRAGQTISMEELKEDMAKW